MTWTVSFAVVTITFMFQFEYLSAPSIGSWSFEAIVFDRVILIVAGFLVLAMLGLALWCRVAIPENVVIVSAALAISLGFGSQACSWQMLGMARDGCFFLDPLMSSGSDA